MNRAAARSSQGRIPGPVSSPRAESPSVPIGAAMTKRILVVRTRLGTLPRRLRNHVCRQQVRSRIRRFATRANACADQLRTPAPSRTGILNRASRKIAPTTALRASARIKYATRYPPAYAHSRSNGEITFSTVGDEILCAMHRPITRPQTFARGGRRVPAQSQPAPTARSLPKVRITIVTRPHAPSIIASWQGSGERSVFG